MDFNEYIQIIIVFFSMPARIRTRETRARIRTDIQDASSILGAANRHNLTESVVLRTAMPFGTMSTERYLSGNAILTVLSFHK